MGLQLIGFPFSVCAFFLGGFVAIAALNWASINDPLQAKTPSDASVSVFPEQFQKVFSDRRLRSSTLFPMGIAFISQSTDAPFYVKWGFLSSFTWLFYFGLVAIDPCQCQINQFIALSSPFTLLYTLLSCAIGSLAVCIFFTPHPDSKSPFLYEWGFTKRASVFVGALTGGKNSFFLLLPKLLMAVGVFALADSVLQASIPLGLSYLEWPLPDSSMHTADAYPPSTTCFFRDLYYGEFTIEIGQLLEFLQIRILRGVAVTASYVFLMIIWSLSQRTLIPTFTVAAVNYSVLMNIMQAYWIPLRCGALLAAMNAAVFALYSYLVYVLFDKGVAAMIELETRGSPPPPTDSKLKGKEQLPKNKKKRN